MTNPLLSPAELPAFSQISPEHVEPALTATLKENREQLDALLADPEKRDFESAIAPLEEMSDRLHKVWSPVSHLHSVVNSPELRDAYNACLPALSQYFTEMGQNKALFDLYDAIAPGLEAGPRKTLVDHALRDFRLAGVDLPADKKARFGELMTSLTQLGAKFEQNLLDAMAAFSVHITDESRLSGLPAAIVEGARQSAADADQEGWLFHLDQASYVAIVTHADDRELRREFYTAWVTRGSDQGPNAGEFDNTQVMNQILAERQELAGLLGFASYADYSLATKMAGSVGEVGGFLESLVAQSQAAGREEFAELSEFAGLSLEPWDLSYYAEKLREDRFGISDNELRPYFPLNRVLEGLVACAERLYGLKIEATAGHETWQEDVQYFAVRDGSGEIIGGFFADFFARRNKRAGAWMDDCVIRKNLGGSVQHPVAHLVCNFLPAAGDQPALLTHDDMVTLFHEFGHTLHHLLTRVDYPSISGINGVPWDAVELPSQFMENFAWDASVLTDIARHYETDEPMPAELLSRLQETRTFQSGMQMLRQLEFALFDWRIHAAQDADYDTVIASTLAAVREEVAVTPKAPFDRFAHGFSHIFGGGYAAGYYSYKWAEVLAADAFEAFADSSLFDPELATSFRRNILEVGGSVDIGKAYEAFRGRPAEVEALLRQSGIAVEGA